MAKVSLRIYNREIETMVDRGELDEAVAHCRHILNEFPKCLETYKLLGKANLEAKRYGEAIDIFQRLLMAVPDDFVAHVGMSIINDEQNDLDGAIWHMQRAFEVQPSNSAIQAELQRLFGRRDGVEPPKIRLTRGALAHMYTQGELYPQAIAEIKAVLEEDRDRQDMQVLLARAYYHAGQKSEAAETCTQLLRRYPYCLDANRVLVELLPETERGESPQVYRNRVNELDPYATFATGSVFHTEEVPDAAVSLERLDWDGQAVDMGPGWGESRGIGLSGGSPAQAAEPDWLRAGLTSGSYSASIPTDEPASAPGGDEDIPDFLREAGWGKDTGTFKEGPGIFDTSDESSEEPALAEADLPDWIKAMAPAGADLSPQKDVGEDLTQDDVPDWLQGLGDVQESPAGEQPLEQGEVPDWLAAMKPAGTAPQAPQPEEELFAESAGDEELPDWLAAMKPVGAEPQKPEPVEELPAEPSGDEGIPDWLIAMKDETSVPQEPVQEDEELALPTSDEDLPDWLRAMKAADVEPQKAQPVEEPLSESVGDESVPDWLQSLQAEDETVATPETPFEAPQEPVQELTQMSSETLSDWQGGEEETKPAIDFDTTDTGTLGTSAAEQDDAIAWLESLAAKHGAKPEELVTDPNARKETAPEWVQQARAVKESSVEVPDADETPAEPVEEFPAFQAEEPAPETGGLVTPSAGVSGAVPTAAEQDDAIAWLESLAAKHGAKPEELVTDPNARKETAPEWVQKSAEASATGEPAPVEEPSESVPEWMEPAKEEPGSLFPELEDTQPQAPVTPPALDETGMWLRDLGGESGLAGEQEEPGFEAELPSMSDEDVPDWLRGMEAEQPKAEAAPAPEEEAEGIPDWLSGLDAEPARIEPGLPSDEPELEVPDWLGEIKTEVSESAPETESGPAFAEESSGVPDWLAGLESDRSAVAGNVDINTASVEELAGLPGVGEFLAENIVAYREIYGPFTSVDDLNKIVGMTPSAVDSLRGQVGFLEGEAASQPEADLADWYKSEETEEAGLQVEDALEETTTDDLPAWLAGLDEESAQPEPAVSTDDDLPDWLRVVDEQETEKPEPTAPTDWRPAEMALPEDLSAPTAAPEPEAEEQPVEDVSLSPSVPEPDEQTPVQAAPPSPAREFEPAQPVEPERPQPVEPAVVSHTGMTGMLSTAKDPALAQAQQELTHGNISGALAGYERLIRKGRLLDEIIFDLREATYRYPVDVSIMQALGDAYMRANRLQDALDAYTKAEELLR